MCAVAVSAEDAPVCDEKLYECYQTRVQYYCTKKTDGNPWASKPNFGKLSSCDYPVFTQEGVNASITCMESAEASKEMEVRDGVSLPVLGNFDGFKAAEVARLLYRKNMNSIFACAIIASRQDKLTKLQEIINKKSPASDIKTKIENEKKRYDDIMGKMNCSQNRDASQETDPLIDRLMASAMLEYCQYGYYLDYLEMNVRENYAISTRTDSNIGTGNTASSPKNTDQALRDMITKVNSVGNERMRAQDVVPKALIAYQEMDRTYIVHVLLSIIFDDYRRLRDGLDNYMAIVGQTFEKAFNAQDANQQ